MKAEELKSKIRFEVTESGMGLATLTGRLEICETINYDARALQRFGGTARAVEEMKEHVREVLVRRVYEDQRRELLKASFELIQAVRSDRSAIESAESRLLKAAKWQEPK